MNHVLAVDLVQRQRERMADRGELLRLERRALEPLVEARAFHVLHHQVGRGLDVAVGHERRMVHALRKRAEHHAALLEADDVGAALACA